MSGFEIIAVVVFIAIVLKFIKKKKKPQERSNGPVQQPRSTKYQAPSEAERKKKLYEAQLERIASVSFSTKKLMNKGEYQVFIAAKEAATTVRQGHSVFSQVSLGEILSTNNKDAFRSINSKRIDLLVIDRSGTPILVLEVQGSGHYLDEHAGTRDSIKKQALESAGVIYEEVFPPINKKTLQARVEQLLIAGNGRESNPVESEVIAAAAAAKVPPTIQRPSL